MSGISDSDGSYRTGVLKTKDDIITEVFLTPRSRLADIRLLTKSVPPEKQDNIFDILATKFKIVQRGGKQNERL